MSGYKRNFKYSTEFDGDTVEFILTGLTRKDVILLTPIFEKVKEDIDASSAQDLADIVLQSVEPHVVSMTGLKDEDGVAIEAPEMLAQQYFFSLSSGLAFHLMEKSNPVVKKEEEKKLEESSPTTSTQEPEG